jgi:hypothetical protein
MKLAVRQPGKLRSSQKSVISMKAGIQFVHQIACWKNRRATLPGDAFVISPFFS